MMKRSAYTLLAGIGAVCLSSGLLMAQQGGPNAEQIFKQMDKNGDGKVTQEEAGEERGRFFERLVRIGDKDDDGALTEQEFTAALQQRPQRADGDAQPGRRGPGGPGGRGGFDAGAIFDRMDTNSDGKLTSSEATERGRGLVLRLLERAGKGEDGSLTKEEFTTLMSQRPEGGPRPGFGGGFGNFRPAVFRLIDTDESGTISKEELAKAAEKFSELDQNGDGSLDVREFMGFGGRGGDRPDGARPAGRRPGGDRPDGNRPRRPSSDNNENN